VQSGLGQPGDPISFLQVLGEASAGSLVQQHRGRMHWSQSGPSPGYGSRGHLSHAAQPWSSHLGRGSGGCVGKSLSIEL
jgi:hypothetical protein